jgi:hypothetical protein
MHIVTRTKAGLEIYFVSVYKLIIKSEIWYTLPPILIPLSGVGTTCFSLCCDKDSAIIFTTGRLPDVNPP